MIFYYIFGFCAMHLQVFKPIIGKDLKLSAEDIETALIEQNSILAQLHVALLKVLLRAFQSNANFKL